MLCRFVRRNNVQQAITSKPITSMNCAQQTRLFSLKSQRFRPGLTILCCLGFCCSLLAQNANQPLLLPKQQLESQAQEQIRLLHEEKLSRTPAQKKMGSQLLYLLGQQRQGSAAAGLKALKPAVR